MRKIVAIAFVLGLCVWASAVNVPKLIGPVKGDEATYVSMALSLAKDGDLKYRREDYRRFESVWGSGPEGIFLKESFVLRWQLHAGWPPLSVTKTPVPTSERLDYGKPFAYALFAAPFAAAFGLGGLLLFNVLLLALCACCAVLFCRARAGAVAGTILGLAFIGASITPFYGAFLTSEIFNFSLVLFAYFLWAYKKVAPSSAPRLWRHSATDVFAIILLGVATFSKPPNGFLFAPIVVMAWTRREWFRGLALGILFGVVTLGFFGANELIAGDWNYQGGTHRNSFYTHFPFDDQGTAFDSGTVMTTNEANDENILAPAYLWPTLGKNVFYFFVGRDAGLLPYFFPGALVALLWLVRIKRSPPWQFLVAGALVLSTLVLLVLSPAIWNGGGGPLGNRYFLSLSPTLLFLLPAGIGLGPAIVAMAVGLTFVGPILVRPFTAKQAVWLSPERWPLRLLPIELTILNQLPVALDPQRWRIQVSENPEVFLYYMDSRTYFKEKDGFWVAPGTAEIVVRTERPLTRLDLDLTSRVPNVVDVTIGGRSGHVVLRPNESAKLQFRPKPGLFALASYQVILKITTASGFRPSDVDHGSTDTRDLGAFIKPIYEVK